MSNSKLATYKRLSPNCTKPRQEKITGIVIHHMAGNLTVKECGAIFAKKSRQASSNYGIDSNGRIALYVDEKNRAWTTGCRIDHRCITIEVANSKTGGDWPVSAKAMKALIKLCVDICERNDIKEIRYTGDKSGNLFMHKWFASTACPGPYLASKFPHIAKEVNEALGVGPEEENEPVKSKLLKVGAKIKVKKNACQYGKSARFSEKVYKTVYKVKEIKGSRVVFTTLDGKTVIGAVSSADCIVQ